MAIRRLTCQQIRKNRKNLGLSQAELGERLGVRQALVSNWETGKLPPAADQRAALLKLFNADAGAGIFETPQASYGDWVSEARDVKSLNRKELAAKVGISEIQVYTTLKRAGLSIPATRRAARCTMYSGQPLGAWMRPFRKPPEPGGSRTLIPMTRTTFPLNQAYTCLRHQPTPDLRRREG